MRSLIAVLVLFFSLAGQADTVFTFDTLPVQNGGRLKPYDTYARESLMLMHGSSKFKKEDDGTESKNTSRKANHIIATMILAPEMWESIPFIRVDHIGLKKALNLAQDQKYFKPGDLNRNPRLGVLIGDLNGKRAGKEKLNPFDQAAQRLESQLVVFHELQTGSMRVAPNTDPQSTTWMALAEIPDAQKELFFKALRSYVLTFTSEEGPTGEREQALAKDVSAAVAGLSANNPASYPSAGDMAIEYHYNALAPFQWSWVFYTLAAILMFLGGLFARNKIIYILSWVAVAGAFVLHTYGFALRVYITERPPVSNMYETVVWVAWGVIVFTALFSLIKKKKYILLAGTMVAALCMIVADRAPLILDGTLQPLEPVLRSNLWLIIHVMTITLSYAAFFLAVGISNVALIHVIRGENINSPLVRDYVDTAYRSLQVGVVLLAAGTILGGVWADYSWGRFWGWDPKETWALIALLGYLALLHGRLAGLVKNFGMLAGSIIAFNLVVMAWYGVNFVLGAGLHSYGFGAGGIEYVAAYVGLQFLFVFFAYVMMLMKEKEIAP